MESALDVAADVAGKVAVAGKSAADIAAPVVERAAVAAKPIGEAGLRYAERTVGPVANDAASKVTGAAGQAISGVEGAIKAKGIDVEPVAGVVGKAGAVAADFASSSVAPAITDFGGFLSTASPTELVEVAAAAGGAYLLAPALLGVVGGAIRGYAGFVRPVEAYDEVLSGGNIVVVDVRSELDAERGTPLFPRRAANKYKSVPREKLQGNFKNMGEVEATPPPPRWRPSRASSAAPRCSCSITTVAATPLRWPRRSAPRASGRCSWWRVATTAGSTPVSPSPSERRRRGRGEDDEEERRTGSPRGIESRGIESRGVDAHPKSKLKNTTVHMFDPDRPLVLTSPPTHMPERGDAPLRSDSFGPLPCANRGWKNTASPGSSAGTTHLDSSKRPRASDAPEVS